MIKTINYRGYEFEVYFSYNRLDDEIEIDRVEYQDVDIYPIILDFAGAVVMTDIDMEVRETLNDPDN